MNFAKNDKNVVDTQLYIRWIKMSLFIILLFFVFIPQVHASASTTKEATTTSQNTKTKVVSTNQNTSTKIDTRFVPLAPIPGLTKGVTADTPGLATFLNNIYKFIVGLSAVLAVIYIIWGGLEIATQDSVSKHEVGKQRIEQAILGLVLVLSPVLIFSIINPSILNLSLNLPVLDTQSGWSKINIEGNTSVTFPSSGCTVSSNSGPYLKTLSCASNQDAQNASNLCGEKLTLYIPNTCRKTDANGTCVDKGVTAYCTGKSSTTMHYKYYKLGSWYWPNKYIGPEYILKSYVKKDNTFTNSCQNNGGITKYDYIPILYDVLGTIKDSWFTRIHKGIASKLRIVNLCPANSGITVKKSEADGVICAAVKMSCVPPIKQ